MSFIQKFSSVMLLALFTLQAGAAARADNAERLLELTHADRLAVPVYAQVQQMFAQRFADAKAPQSRKAVLERYQAKANTVLDRAIGWNELKPELVALYKKEFTEQELKGMVEFYESALGSKMLAKLPELNRRSAQMAQASLEAAVPEVNKLLAEMTNELGNTPKK
ncbi:DUF2059 domain-containing protein [Azomonas macrocytogenes]|uniref:DUF2059 domain-containing protein n=1 Tax=Azomonas macrocytogenes TaxID=69962 RepID=A0A839T3X3_AZOMA|nr:hypothetical protein [Azomonas macrocytogenes]